MCSQTVYKHIAVAFLSEKAQKLVDGGLFLPVSEEAADWEDDLGAHDHGAEPDGADGEAGGAGTRHVDTPPPNAPQLGGCAPSATDSAPATKSAHTAPPDSHRAPSGGRKPAAQKEAEALARKEAVALLSSQVLPPPEVPAFAGQEAQPEGAQAVVLPKNGGRKGRKAQVLNDATNTAPVPQKRKVTRLPAITHLPPT